MNCLSILGLTFLLVLGLGPAQSADPLKLVSTFKLPPEVTGHFDHLAVDTVRQRLFVTPEAFKSVLVLDERTGQVIQRIEGIGVPHAVLYREDIDEVFVTDGEPGELKIYKGSSYRLMNSIKLSAHTDSITFDSRRKLLYAVTGGKDAHDAYSTVVIVDTTSARVVGKIRVESEALEAMTVGKDGRLYINDKAKNRIDVFDVQSRALIATWPITQGENNTSLALDEVHHRLFVGCRSGTLVQFDARNGKEMSATALTKGVDDMTFDPATGRIYAACGDGPGFVDVYVEGPGDAVKQIGHVPSGPLGKTALFSKAQHRYFVSVPSHGSDPASVLVYDIQ